LKRLGKSGAGWLCARNTKPTGVLNDPRPKTLALTGAKLCVDGISSIARCRLAGMYLVRAPAEDT
jgi:hypothetical protein